MKKEEIINQIIQERKSVYPIQYIDKEIPQEIILQILENADRAPTHKLTEPWRFKVVSGNKKNQLAEFLSSKYKQITASENYKEDKYNKIESNINRADKIILICFQKDPKNQLPEWEEIAATAMAVQNMYLTCTAYNIGCYWSSPNLIEYINEFIPLENGEKCIGLFYMVYYIVYYNVNLPISKISPLSAKINWYN